MALAASVNGSIAWQSSAVHYTGAASAALNVPSGAVGIASFAWQNNNFQAPATITDTSGNVWTRRINATSPLTSSGFNIKVAVYTSPIFPSADSAWEMVMVDGSGSNYSLDNITAAVQFWSGFPAGSAAIDVAAWTGAIPSSAFTTTTASELVAYVAHGYGSDITVSSGYAEGVDNTRLAIHWQEVSAIQTAATVSPGNCSAVAVLTLTAAPAGPVLSTPTVVSTGNTIATVRVTTDTAPTGSSILAVRTRPAGDPAWTAAEVLASPTATITSGASGARDFNLTGLTNGTALAADFAQTGPSNVVSTASFTPSTVPGAPTIGTATAGNAQATVAGTAPVSNGGSAITGYRSTATPGGSTVTGVSLPITHTGLTNGTAYTFTLAAQNANGYGAESAASNSVTPSSGADVTPPTLSSPSGAGGTLTCSGSVTTDEANGTLYTVATDSTTAPTALQVEAGQDHTGAAALRVVSQAVSASGSQAVASGAVTAGTRYLHFMHKDAAGNRSSVASSAAFTVSASVSATYTATTDILARNGIALASTPIFWSWLPAGRPGAVGSVVNGTGTTDSAGRYTLSQSAAGQGLLLIGLALGSWDADAPGFAQYLTLA